MIKLESKSEQKRVQKQPDSQRKRATLQVSFLHASSATKVDSNSIKSNKDMMLYLQMEGGNQCRC
jgi:hypothetical protein